MAHWISKQVLQTWWGSSWNFWTFNVDFWTNTTNLYQKTVTVSNANIKTTSRPIVQLYNSWWRDIDELEWVNFTFWVASITPWVWFTAYVDDKNRVAEWIYTFNYSF